MKSDLQNVILVAEGEQETDRRYIARHIAFPEVSAERRTPREALHELVRILKRSAGWDEGLLPDTPLQHALFEVEVLLKILASSEQLKISGSHCTVTKMDDLIYVMNYASADQASLNGGSDEQGRENARERVDSVTIYKVGRRYGDRREETLGMRLRANSAERRVSERRTADRRSFIRPVCLERDLTW